jgi:hypothetical protein
MSDKMGLIEHGSRRRYFPALSSGARDNEGGILAQTRDAWDDVTVPTPHWRSAATAGRLAGVGGLIRIVVAAVALSSLLLLLLMLFAFRPAPTRVVANVVAAEPVRVAAPDRAPLPPTVEPERAPPPAVVVAAAAAAQRAPPVVVEPERVTPIVPARVRTVVAEPDRVTPVKKTDDFCSRYGLHKVITRGGRSWRCQK